MNIAQSALNFKNFRKWNCDQFGVRTARTTTIYQFREDPRSLNESDISQKRIYRNIYHDLHVIYGWG